MPLCQNAQNLGYKALSGIAKVFEYKIRVLGRNSRVSKPMKPLGIWKTFYGLLKALEGHDCVAQSKSALPECVHV